METRIAFPRIHGAADRLYFELKLTGSGFSRTHSGPLALEKNHPSLFHLVFPGGCQDVLQREADGSRERMSR